MARRKKRFKKNIIKFFLSIILVSLVSYISFAGYDHFFGNNNSSNDGNVIKNNNNNKKPEAKDEVYKLKLLATGDGLIHSVIYRSYYKNGVYDFTDAVKYVKDIVKDYDIAYYNQETPTGDDSIAYSGYPMFYTPSAYVDAMQDVGFNTVSLASNHSLDKGEKGVLNTIKYFKTTNMLYNGMNDSEKMRNNFTIKEKNNITYTMLSYTTKTNGLSTPKGKEYLINIYDKEQVKKDIEAIRDKVDVLIVAMHWGIEYIDMPNDEEKEIAEYLSSLGVDIIIGNHPHILQPITKIGDTIVMYSLGNFISNQYGGTNGDWNKLIGFMATLDITKTVTKDKTVKMTFDNLGGELIFTKYNGNPVTTAVHDGHTVIPFSIMKDDRYLKDYERLYKKYTDVLTAMGENLNIAPVGSRAN
jgi:hypothetical protein hcinC1_06185